MSLIPIAFGIGASLATLTGGLLALRLQHRIVFALGVTAGVVLGVAVFDLVPEALELAHGYWTSRISIGFMAVGLGFYMPLDRALRQATWLQAGWRTHLGPATLTLHSLMDGMGIGSAFQISADAGWLIALPILMHDIGPRPRQHRGQNALHIDRLRVCGERQRYHGEQEGDATVFTSRCQRRIMR